MKPAYTVREGGVEIEISSAKSVVKWDGHAAFRQGIGKLSGTKAVDIAVRTDDDRVVLMELKDFRGHAIENRPRLKSGDLALEVAVKVRDTLAGITWALARGHADAAMERLAEAAFLRGTSKLLVVLWLDQDDRADPVAASALQAEIQQHLRLPAKVLVTSLKLHSETNAKAYYPWLTIRSCSKNVK